MDSNHRVGYLIYSQARSPLRHRRKEGRTGFEPVSNGFTNRFLSHLDHDPVDQEGLEPSHRCL